MERADFQDLNRALPEIPIALLLTTGYKLHNMRWLVSLVLGIALVAGMSHAPAMAHPDETHAHSSGEISTAESASDNHHEDSQSSPGTAESNAHTHLPPALATIHDSLFGSVFASKKQFLFVKTDVLTSFSQAPPTEPPSA